MARQEKGREARGQGPAPFTVLRGAVLAPRADDSLEFWPDGAVAFDQNGIIRYSGPASAADSPLAGGLREARIRFLDPGAPSVILPGFVDVHVHLPQLDLRGRNPAPLLDWLQDQVFAVESTFAASGRAAAGAVAFDEALLACGTTAAGVFVTVHEEATRLALDRLRVRGVIGKVLMDREAPQELCEAAAEGIAATERLLAAAGPRTAVTPRFAVSCSSGLLTAAGELARRRAAPVMTHLAESPEEVAAVRNLFPDHQSYTEVYADHGLLTPRTIVAHTVHLAEEEWRILARAGCGVAHCPTANLALGSGRMPLERLREHRVRYALGTDVGAGPSLSLWHVIDAFLRVHRGQAEVTPAEALYRATVAGSELLGLAGGIEPGRPADLAVFRRPSGIPETASGDALVRVLAARTADEPEPHTLLTICRGEVVHGAAG
jgi:guanine deaminase